jgi:hypothetical protein
MQPTIDQAMTNLKTVFGRLLSDSNKSAEGTKSVAEEIMKLADTIEQNKPGIIELFTEIISLAGKAARAIGNIGQSLQGWGAVKRGELGIGEFATMGPDDLKKWLAGNDTEEKRIQNQIAKLQQKRAGAILPHYQIPIDKEIAQLQAKLKATQGKESTADNYVPSSGGAKISTGAAGKEKKEKKTEAEKRLKQGEQAIMQLEREKATIGDITREEKMRWEVAQGQYKSLSEAHKGKLVALAAELDALDAVKEADEEAKKNREAAEAEILNLQREAAAVGEVTREEKMLWEVTEGKYKDLDASQKKRLVSLAAELDSLSQMDEAEKEIIKNWEENEKTIEGLREQAATIGMTEAQVTLYKLALKDATAEQIAAASATLADIEKKNELKQILEDIRSPYQDYQDKIATANALLAEGSLSIEDYTLYMAKLAKDMEKLADDGKDQFAELKRAIEGWGKDSAEAMAEFCTSGKADFSDMVNSIIKDLLKMSFYQNISPIFSGISGWISNLGGGSSGGFTSSTYSSFGSSFSFLSGGRAGGGSVSPGKMYEVNETGIPELLNVGNRQFLMMGNQNGYVEAFKASAGGGSRQGSGSGSGDTYTIINISAVDSQSFADAVKRNPASIVNVVNGSLKNNAYGLRNTMKRTR